MVEVVAKTSDKVMEILKNMPHQTRVTKDGGMIKILFPVGTANLEFINNYCFTNAIILNHLLLKKKSLEARFFELTNN